MVDLSFALENIHRQALAPTIVDEVRDDYDDETLAEICAAIEATVREESIERDVGKHGGIACLYLVIDRLANVEEADDD